MIVTVQSINITKDEIKSLDRTNPNNVVASFIQTITEYNPKSPETFLEKLQILVGDMQPLSEMMKQNIKDRMTQNDKYNYIGKSYFVGATPENDYTPSTPYKIEVEENPYSKVEEGLLKLFVKSGGSDSPRPIMVRLAKDGNYYVWSDSFMGLLADIKPLESTNPWA